MNEKVRVRFAPSPTGYLHVGGLRTALYNYLFARRRGGVFILRVEDTDQNRSVPGAVELLIESLRWSGLIYDEGPDVGGPHGPYLQSKRLPLYREAADRLLASGHAYRCFCTPERLERMRKERKETRYDRTCLSLPPEQVAASLAAATPHTVRLRIPDGETLILDDLIRGRVAFESSGIDDQILMKSDGFPTYHLANVVDDHEMQISHVIRGEEWLPSAPKHLLLYRYLGYDLPLFAHLPLLLNPDRSKLSKREGHVSVEELRSDGFIPEALINFIVFMGWNPGGEREIYSLEELVDAFSLERVNKAGAIFNVEKLRWFNQEYMRRRPEAETIAGLKPLLAAKGWKGFDDEYLTRVIQLMRDRVTFVADLATSASWFFTDPETFEEETRAKRWNQNSAALLQMIVPRLESLERFDAASIEQNVVSLAEEEGLKPGDLIHPLRLAVSGMGKGPGLYEMLEVLGREVCVRRVRRAIQVLG